MSKETLDANCARGLRKQAKIFANSPDGWRLVLSWLKALGSKQAHVCMEATGRHSLGVALALYDAGHIVSVVNPAQIRDFARAKLGRNKTDKVDAALIGDYAALRGRRDLLLSVSGVGETLAALLLVEMPSPEVLRRSGEMVAYAGLNPSHYRSGSSIDRPTRISKIGNATLRSSLYMPALSAMRFNPAVAALVARLKEAGRLKPKQIVVAAMRKLLVICFGVLKTGRPFDPAIAMPA